MKQENYNQEVAIITVHPDDIPQLIEQLEKAGKEAQTIRGKSPMACKVTLKLLVESPYQLHFVDEMRMEYGIMVRLIHHPDFQEGVRALLIDKDNAPNWRPSNPAVIGDAEVEAFFEPLPVEEQWRPFDF